MHTFNNVHQQFAEFFDSESLKPYAYLVSKKFSEGHICIDLPETEVELAGDPFYGGATFIGKHGNLASEPFVTTAKGPKQPFVLHNDKLYMQRYFNYETIILNRVQQFLQSEQKTFQSRIQFLTQNESLIKKLFRQVTPSKPRSETFDWQLVAALSAVINDFTIITGGPGTGKTTTVAKILALLYSSQPDLRVALAAPTGKAAARMADSLKEAKIDIDNSVREIFQQLTPSTLHRLLKADPGSTRTKYNRDNCLQYDVVIVDESSMIDVALFAKLLDAIGEGTRLILLGDKDQLASVEAGSLFGDLCKAQPSLNRFSADRIALINTFIEDKPGQLPIEKIPPAKNHPLFEHIIELRHSHRFVGDQGIGRFSRAIINNDEATIEAFISNPTDNEVSVDSVYDESLFNDFVKDYRAYIDEKDITSALAKLNNLRILCATREGDHGLYNTNRRIERLLQQKGLINTGLDFYEHRPIMVSKNYYDLKLFNGDVGIIRKDENGTLKAWFLDSERNLKSVLPGFVADSETVFAMTIHKSQGSEFENVLVMLPDNADIAILTRELLYTAVTRAKKKVLVQGTPEVIKTTAARSVKRASGIRERFEEKVQ